MGNHSVIVLDFETSGLSPSLGDRVIEVGAVRLEGGRIVERFQGLMNPGFRVSSFIEGYTGISNAMLAEAPPAAEVMRRFAGFIGETPLVAHNASFDRRFLDAELERLRLARSQEMACSMLVARRVYPDAPGHSLEALVRHKRLPTDGVHHRALADAEMTGHLWLRMIADLQAEYRLNAVPFALLQRLSKVSKAAAPAWLRQAATP